MLMHNPRTRVVIINATEAEENLAGELMNIALPDDQENKRTGDKDSYISAYVEDMGTTYVHIMYEYSQDKTPERPYTR